MWLKFEVADPPFAVNVHAVFSPALPNATLLTHRLSDHLKKNGAAVRDGLDVVGHLER